MKNSRFIKLLIFLVCAFIAQSCSSPNGMIYKDNGQRDHAAELRQFQEKTIQKNEQRKAERSNKSNGKIRVGMTKQEVINAWGQPCWHCYGTRKTSNGDTWEYNVFGSGSMGAGSGTYLFFDRNDVLKYWSQ